MTRFYLVRHGAHDLLGRSLAGRMPGVGLNAEGRVQAERLAAHFAALAPAAVISSPLQRTVETARPIAARLGLELELEPGLLEIDFGDWTGRPFAELDGDPAWPLFNSARSLVAIPGGESLIDVQTRMIATLRRLAAARPEASLVLVGHGDPLKSAIAYFLGVPIDLQRRIEIAPGSVSDLELRQDDVVVNAVNLQPASTEGS
ncbi:MAG: histidine phosphatase family protein [Dongiaceae bacterium]